MNTSAATTEVSLPWKTCVSMGFVFGVVLISLGNDLVSQFIRDMQFNNLDPKKFFYSAVGAMAILIARRNSLSNSSVKKMISTLYNGLVGGYLGLAIWHIWIGLPNDGVEFLAYAWICYVYFFLSLDIVNNRV